jgi:hypothetical protein
MHSAELAGNGRPLVGSGSGQARLSPSSRLGATLPQQGTRHKQRQLTEPGASARLPITQPSRSDMMKGPSEDDPMSRLNSGVSAVCGWCCCC